MPSFASAVFDLLMLGIIVGIMFIGKKVGLLRMVFILGIVFFAALIARLTVPLVNSALTNMKLGDSVKSSVRNTVNGWIKEDEELDFDGVVKKLGLPDGVADVAEKSVSDIRSSTGEALAEKTSDFVSKATVKLVSYVSVAVIVILILVIISLITKIVNKIPILGTVNALFGVLVGLVTGIVIVFLTCVFVSSVGIGSTTGVLSDITQRSYFIKLLGNIGVIGGIIK